MDNNTNQAWKNYINTDTVLAFIKKCFIFALYGACFEIVCANLLDFVLRHMPEIASEYSAHIDNLTSGTNATVIAVIGFLSPIFEELIFRGLILMAASKLIKLLTKEEVISFIIANIIQAVCFGFDHTNIVQISYAVILGFFIGMILKITGNIIYCMCFHTGLNLCGLALSVVLPVGSPFGKIISYIIVALVLIIVISVWIYRNYRKK